MKLFKDITIKEKLTTFTIPDFDQKIAIIKTWSDDYHHGSLKTDKETSRAGGYNQAIFSDVLGYVRKPSPQATFDAEYSLQGKFPDGVLGYFHTDDEKEDNVCAVVELKGAAIPLDQPQKREKNYTPIEQGFGYKRLLRNCPFVIVSNFYELRLYNDNEIDYEVWTLDDLLDPTDDYFNFKKFYYLLCAENLIAETGSSKTESLMSDIRLEEQSITKKFYADYKSRRHLLLQNLYQKNEVLRNDPDLLIEMGQKLIDRVIFMCFAEDRGLLPADILQTIKRDFEKSAMVASVWDSLKIAFNYVNKGNENWGIPDGYNGGLFARDDRFDDLKIEGHILSKIIDFGMYDFADQLSVTILGHIFEQSISDLEDIKEKIEELGKAEEELVEKKTSKRKKDGIFYTPEYIVDYIVKNSLGVYLREHETKMIEQENLHDELSEKEYIKREQVVYTKYQQFLSNVKVLDPACGSGAFLVRVFDYLLEDNRRVGKILGGLFNTDEMYKSILQNNIYGVDLNAESVEITKLSLWLKSAQKGKKLSNLDDNIKCGNSLIDDVAVAGEKAFNWEKEFPFCDSERDSESRGFDVIVGNPPYVNIENVSKKERDFILDFYETAEGRTDLYIAFLELSLGLVSKNGYVSFIIPSAITNQNYSEKIRNRIISENFLQSIVDTTAYNVFSQAMVKTVILNIQNNDNKKETKIYISKEPNNLTENFHIIDQSEFRKLDKSIFETNQFTKLLPIKNKIEGVSINLEDIYFVAYGVRINNKIDKSKPKNYYVHEKNSLGYKPFIEGKNIERYYHKQIGWLNYQPQEHYNSMFPELFENEKIFFINIVSEKIRFSLDSEHLYNSHTVINCVRVDLLQSADHISAKRALNKVDINLSKKFDNRYILTILNSNLLNWYFMNFQSEGLHFYPDDAKKLPIFANPDINQQPFIEKADIMLELNKKFHEQSSRFITRMVDNYRLEKANKKLQKFWELDFGDFVKEMRKKGATVALSTQDELQDYFDIKKSELLELYTQIKSTDAEIDKMVYELYGLNDEEIRIIENS